MNEADRCPMCGQAWTPYRYAEPHERKAVGERIDVATADVRKEWGWIMDPYGDLGPAEEDNYGGLYFAADPMERVWVCFYDLPMATVNALWARSRDGASPA